MKKANVMSNCQYTRLALLSLLDSSEVEVTVGPIDYGYFWCSRERDTSTFIHIGGNDYKSIAEITKYSQSIKFRESTFITTPEIMPFLCFVAKCRLQFVDDKLNINELKNKIVKNRTPSEIMTTKSSLTTNEILVLNKLLSGMSLTSIAFHTKKSIKTVSSQKISALHKLNLNNSAHSMAKLNKYIKIFMK